MAGDASSAAGCAASPALNTVAPPALSPASSPLPSAAAPAPTPEVRPHPLPDERSLALPWAAHHQALGQWPELLALVQQQRCHAGPHASAAWHARWLLFAATALHGLHATEAARTAAAQAATLAALDADLLDGLMRLHWALGDDAACLLHARTLLALRPGHGAAHAHAALVLHQRDGCAAWPHYQAALTSGALAPVPGLTHTLYQAAAWAFDIEAAEALQTRLYAETAAAAPGDDAQRAWLDWQHSFFRFAIGDYPRAWALYERRHDHPDIAQSHRFALPRWDGSWPPGLRLLVHGEQGLGDEIMFASCLPALLAEAAQHRAQVVLAVKPGLQRLFADSFPACEVVCHDHIRGLLADAAGLGVQAHMPLASLPTLYARSEADFARNARQPYLRAHPQRVQHMAQVLDQLRPGWPQRLRVGVAWACQRGKGALLDSRAIPIEHLQSLQQVDKALFISLHNQDHSHELAAAPSFDVLDLGALQGDFADTAALVHHMDVVIAVDSSVAHLAGAMGRTVWQPLLRHPDWRHGAPTRQQSLWYAHTRYFRQTHINDWSDVIARLAQSLHGAAAQWTPGDPV